MDVKNRRKLKRPAGKAGLFLSAPEHMVPSRKDGAYYSAAASQTQIFVLSGMGEPFDVSFMGGEGTVNRKPCPVLM
ncbi:hypothetical protein BHK98_09235 [Hornefia porci]|uniref:Uncharacterized protein n=1 Tax=Hornefia porci TaxID=2652292 RepID=A0A1Q9JJB6_9FIRM|nr:hypothetical protein BHK98_09235 [Hornefia porci]